MFFKHPWQDGLHWNLRTLEEMAAVKIHVFGHSFVHRLKRFISDSTNIRYDLGLRQSVLVQYSGFPGAKINTLHEHLDVIEDFAPDIVVLMIGTNDIYSEFNTPSDVASDIVTLVGKLVTKHRVQYVIVGQILHRAPAVFTRYPVDLEWFNCRVDATNQLISRFLEAKYPTQSRLWRFTGFWSTVAKQTVFARDGTHLTNDGQFKLFNNIRAAVIAVLNNLF